MFFQTNRWYIFLKLSEFRRAPHTNAGFESPEIEHAAHDHDSLNSNEDNMKMTQVFLEEMSDSDAPDKGQRSFFFILHRKSYLRLIMLKCTFAVLRHNLPNILDQIPWPPERVYLLLFLIECTTELSQPLPLRG